MNRRQRQLPLSAHLILLTFVSVVPALLLAASLLVVLSKQQKQHIEEVIQSTTQALATAVDKEISYSLSMLRLIAEVDDFSPARMERLHQRAQRMVAQFPNWHSIQLVRKDGQIILDTAASTAKPLGRLADTEIYKSVLATGETTIRSEVSASPFEEKLIYVYLPARLASQETYLVIGKIWAKSLSNIFHEQRLDDAWTAAILDENTKIIGRSRAPEKFFGKVATPELARRSRERTSDIFEDVTQEGARAYGSFKRLETVNWTLVLGLSASALDAPFRSSLSTLTVTGFVFLLLALMLAALIGRKISAPINALSRSAEALSRGQEPAPIGSTVKELTQVSDAMMGAARAIKETGMSLSSSESRFRTLFQQAPFSAQLLSLDGRTLQVNLAWQKLWQMPNEVVENYILKAYNILTDPQLEAAGITPYILEAYAGNSVVTKPIWYDPKAIGQPGRPRWLLAYVHPIKDQNGKVLEVMLIHHDITDHKEAEEQLKIGKDAAESASRLKSAFLANMSHEIRTPLGAILGFTEMLKSGGLLEQEQKNYLEIIERSGRSLVQIINDILDLSRIEADTLIMEKTPVRVSELIHETVSMFQLEAKKKNVVLTAVVDPGVPAFIHTDLTRVRQILINLIGNALKFTEAGSVEVRAEIQNENIAVTVNDTGIGIPAERQHLLFQPFSQMDSSNTRKFGGTGLGLALSKKLANALGGDITYFPRSGRGSTFTFTHPKNPVDRPNTHTESASLPSGDREPLRGLKVLVVEDSPENRLLVERMLARHAASVKTAFDGQDAIEKIESENFDIVLMDVQMPRLDGLEATRRLRKRGYARPIIALTAHAMKEDIQRSIDAGCNAHVSKPFTSETLTQVILDQIRE